MKRYGRAYFDRWYRNPQHRVTARAELERKVRMVLGIAEYMLGRPIRTVLDVGCGEGGWQPLLRRLRPRAEYTGVDPSAYAVRRFGRHRHIFRGSLVDLEAFDWPRPFDLVVCCDVLHYVPATELKRGIKQLAALVGGMAYLELHTTRDAIEGDMRQFRARPAAYYRRIFRESGMTRCGPHCYVGREVCDRISLLEQV